MGLTGHAFRITVCHNDVHIAGPIDPMMLTAAAKEKRGLQEELPAALDLIHRSIDRGIPVLSWDMFIPEFGVIYGYVDVRRILTAMECMQDDKLPYDHIGRGTLEDLFLLALEERTDKDQRTMLRDALAMILDHYYAKEAPTDRGERGLRAYDVWLDAFHGGNVEPNGNRVRPKLAD